MSISGTADTVAASLVGASEPPPTARLRAGQIVGHYEITGLLGAGGMGEVYLGRDVRLGRLVAVKIVRTVEQGAACGALCALLMREAQTLARLSHPGIVAVHDVGEHEGCVYVTMELIDGVRLREWARDRTHPWRDRARVLLDAGRALVAAHAARIVHRDVKPENVLVERTGRVVVMDFGVARSLADRDDATGFACGCSGGRSVHVALDGMAVGTPGYMSPEQWDGLPADMRSDQFGFAATCWDVLYGTPPFAGSTLAQIEEAVVAQRVEPPADTDIPAAMADALRRGLRVAPSARYPSLAAFVARLEEIGTG